jgi:hypothetical protein
VASRDPRGNSTLAQHAGSSRVVFQPAFLTCLAKEQQDKTSAEMQGDLFYFTHFILSVQATAQYQSKKPNGFIAY